MIDKDPLVVNDDVVCVASSAIRQGEISNQLARSVSLRLSKGEEVLQWVRLVSSSSPISLFTFAASLKPTFTGKVGLE
jgi:hypothetical protein